MLVATPGQTTAYHPTLHSSSNSSSNSAPKQTCHSSSSNTTSSSAAAAKSSLNNKLPAESSTGSGNAGNGTTSSLMKTLSVRLNRGTEFLKGTVQKALISTTTTTTTTTIPNSNNNNYNNANTITTNSHSNININNPNKAATTTIAKATATTHVTSSNNSSVSRPIAGGGGSSVATANAVRNSSSHSLSTGVTASRIIAAASSTGCSAAARLKLYTVPPTVIHRHPEERLRTSSVDSLHKEMCHFKPIRAAPTTPLKSCTKSRGVSLKTPKANLATRINLHANCDVSKDWVEHEGDDKGSESDQRMDELNLYKHFKPKPSSTVLTTIITTPTHQSAFVCLVAQMKNLSTQSSSKGTPNTMNVHKTKSDRGRKKLTGRKSGRGKSIATVGTVTRQKVSLHKGRNPFVHVKKLHLPADLIISRTLQAAREAKIEAQHKNKDKSAISGAASTTAISVNAAAGGVESRRKMRKRKIYFDLTDVDESAQPMARKSARISKDCSNDITTATAKSATATKSSTRGTATGNKGKRATGSANGNSNTTHKRGRRPGSKKSVTTSRVSPPLTRARLKQMSNGKLLSALNY